MMYNIFAFYILSPIKDPSLKVLLWKDFLHSIRALGRIYISAQGINAQLSIHSDYKEKFINWLGKDHCIKSLDIKIAPYKCHCFPRLTVKYKKQLVALDTLPGTTQKAQHLAPSDWERMLRNRREDTFLLDVRNAYEWKVGHFEGANKPSCKSFRDFPKYFNQLSEKMDKKNTKIMMYCTGGIRCEIFSSFVIDKGYTNVYQLSGGVIKYGHKCGNKHWKGNLFVFDDRLVVPLDSGSKPISRCHFCSKTIDTHYNCSNMDCNKLFISCLDCLKDMQGTCSTPCSTSKRVRDPCYNIPPTPFRRIKK